MNNPLRLIDPTGMFVIDPNLSQDDQDKIKAGYNKLKDSLSSYKVGSADYKRIQRALTKLGGIGVKNGITITLGQMSNPRGEANTIPTAITNAGRANAKVDSTITLNKATFQDKDTVDLAGALGHEGTHAADFDVVARTYKGPMTGDAFLAAFNSVRYSSEFNAYMLEGAVHQALAPDKEFHFHGNIPVGPQLQLPRTYTELSLWNPAWAKLDASKIQSIRSANVNSLLMTPKNQGGDYGLVPPR